MSDLDQFTRTEREFRDALAATRQVVLDLHKALGVEWGGDPYAAIAARDAEVARLRKAIERALYILDCIAEDRDPAWFREDRRYIRAALAQPKEPQTCVGPADRDRPCAYCGSKPGHPCYLPAEKAMERLRAILAQPKEQPT